MIVLAIILAAMSILTILGYPYRGTCMSASSRALTLSKLLTGFAYTILVKSASSARHQTAFSQSDAMERENSAF